MSVVEKPLVMPQRLPVQAELSIRLPQIVVKCRAWLGESASLEFLDGGLEILIVVESRTAFQVLARIVILGLGKLERSFGGVVGEASTRRRQAP